MKKKKVTYRDIALAAGVSVTAVSFALTGKDGVNDATRATIFETAQRLGYTLPSPARKVLNIALLFRSELHEFDQLFYSEMNTFLIDAGRSLPCNLIMTTAFYDEDEVRFSDILYTGKIDGLLVFGDPDVNILGAIIGLKIPFVILDSSRRYDSSDSCLAVCVDYEEAAYQAACYLIDRGHTDIAYIGNNSKSIQDFTLLTFRGFQKATEKHGIALNTNRIQLDISDEISLRRAVDRAIEGNGRPTALFCCADYYAIFAIRYLHSRNLRVPEDISVISIDDIHLSRFLSPALTTVRINQEEIVRRGIALLMDRIRGNDVQSITIRDFEIAARESVAARMTENS